MLAPCGVNLKVELLLSFIFAYNVRAYEVCLKVTGLCTLLKKLF